MRRPLRSEEARAIANLAIDLGDPGRMSKARRLHRSNAVSAVDIESGIACASVVDPTGEVHDVDVSVVAPPVNNMLPTASDLVTSCTCDDHGDTCMHALAALLGIAEEVEVNGRIVELWTGSVAPEPRAAYASPEGNEHTFFTGPWASGTAPISLSPLRMSRQPVLVVDEVDSGPVFIDAREAITRALSRYRARV